MPLIILGLLVVIGIVIYALARNRQNEEVDTRTVRERYPHVFEKFDEIKRMKKSRQKTSTQSTAMKTATPFISPMTQKWKKEKEIYIEKCRSANRHFFFISQVSEHTCRQAASRVPFPYRSRHRTLSLLFGL